MRSSILSCIVLLAVPQAFGQRVLYELEGDSPGRGQGDVNADGYADLIARWGPAGVRVFSGRDGALIHDLRAPDRTHQAGHAGDVDGDGFDDVIAGCPSAAGFRGAVVLWSGRLGTLLYAFEGGTDRQLGDDVSAAGDVNQDGFDDFLAAANPISSSTEGVIHLFSGRDGTALFSRKHESTTTCHVSDLGDVNNDGFADFCELEVDRLVRIYSGQDFSVIRELPAFSGSLACAEGAGDLDADGFDDVIVGEPLAEHAGVEVGNASVYSGRTGAVLLSLWGDAAQGEFGRRVDRAGDVNADQHGDVLVSAPFADVGATGVGLVGVYSGRESATLRSIRGQRKGDTMGIGLSSTGDVDQDGIPDILVSRTAQPLVVLSGQLTPAAWSTYGTGWPGSDGVPRFASQGTPALCSSINLLLDSSRTGGATDAVILVGSSPASIPTAYGGTLLVLPQWQFTLTLPEGGVLLPLSIPCGFEWCGESFYLQALEVDPGASNGVSFTEGLQLTLGS